MSIEKSVALVAQAWADTKYYDNAEKLLDIFWHPQSLFVRLFSALDLYSVIELACGHGRHAEVVAELSGHLHLMDVHGSNIEYCRNRLGSFENISYYVSNGYDFNPIEDDSISAIFCYDAMVHFTEDVVESYIQDTSRVLRKGGRALYHHSNFSGPMAPHYGQNPGARNFMTQGLFEQCASLSGLNVVESSIIQWGGVQDLDCVTLLEKP